MSRADDIEDLLIYVSRCQREALTNLETIMTEKTYAMYLRPAHGQRALRTEDPEFATAAEARRTRSKLKQNGVDALIHVGFEHPDPLPLGETLWQEPGGSVE